MKPRIFGQYVLIDRLGHGGMGEVFLARQCGHAGLERLVAIKRIHGQVAAKSRALGRFTDEANIAARLSHPGIAQIYDFGEIDGRCYIAMEYIQGRDVAAIFRRYQSHGHVVPPAQACYIVMRLCEALDHAHNRKDYCGRPLDFVHRDISPRNLMLSFDGDVKLIDFGVAKAVCRAVTTEEGSVRGTPAYMSPEHLLRDRVDARADVFGCGIVLFELLTGQRLFYCKDMRTLLRKVAAADVPRLRECNPVLSGQLETIVMKALEGDPDDRYQSAAKLYQALADFVTSQGMALDRSEMARWMKELYSSDYIAESQRIAALWARNDAEAIADELEEGDMIGGLEVLAPWPASPAQEGASALPPGTAGAPEHPDQASQPAGQMAAVARPDHAAGEIAPSHTLDTILIHLPAAGPSAVPCSASPDRFVSIRGAILLAFTLVVFGSGTLLAALW